VVVVGNVTAGYLDDPDIWQYATWQTGASGVEYRYDGVVRYLQRAGQCGADLLSRAGSGLADQLVKTGTRRTMFGTSGTA